MCKKTISFDILILTILNIIIDPTHYETYNNSYFISYYVIAFLTLKKFRNDFDVKILKCLLYILPTRNID